MSTNDSIIAKKGCYILEKGYPYIIVAYSEHENNILYSEYILLIDAKFSKDNYWIDGRIKYKFDPTQSPVDYITVDKEIMVSEALEKAECILHEKVEEYLGDKSIYYLRNNEELSDIDKKILLHLHLRGKFKEMFSSFKEKFKCQTLNNYIHRITQLELFDFDEEL